MKKKRFWPSLLKRTAVWTLIAGIISGGFGGGVYLVYQDSLRDIEVNTSKYADEVNVLYLLNRTVDPKYSELLKDMDLEYDYSYFGKVNEDGSLTDIYETSYDDFDIWLSSNENELIGHNSRRYYGGNMFYSTIDTSDERYTQGDNHYYRYRLTHDPAKAGKVETETYYPYDLSHLKTEYEYFSKVFGIEESNTLKVGDSNVSYVLKTRYLLCSDAVFDLIRSSGLKADKKNTRTMLYNTMAGNYSSSKKRTYYDSSLRITYSPDVRSAWINFVSTLSPYLFGFRTGSDEDPATKNGLSINCEIDKEQGWIGVSTIEDSGKQNKIYDSGYGTFDDHAWVDRVNIERPDSILEKYGDVFKPSKFNYNELIGLITADNSAPTVINNAILEHVDSINGFETTTHISSEELITFYQPSVIDVPTERRYEDGHVILAGFMALDNNIYRYAYTIPFAGFWESAGTDILGAALKIWLCGFVILLIVTLISYERYLISFRQAQFKDGLIDAVAHNMKTPMQVISVNAENLYEPASEEARKTNIDSILAETRDVSDMVGKILSLAEKGAQKSKFNVRKSVEETAEKAGVNVNISGDAKIKADKKFFEQALFNLLDNAGKYKQEDSEITVRIDRRKMLIDNNCKEDKFTPGAGIAIADRYLSQTGMSLKQRIKDGRFISEIRF